MPGLDLASGRRLDLVALGEPLIEFNQTHAGEPGYLQGFGGDTSNAAIAAARAGARTAYLSRIGQDWLGRALLDLWAREGVDASAVTQDPARPTAVYFVTHGPSGHEFSYYLRHLSAAAAMTPAWLPAALLADTALLHVSGISLAISDSAQATVLAAMATARASGTRVALDSNLRLKLWSLDKARSVLTQAIGLCDLFLPSQEDLQQLTGLSDPRAQLDWSHAQGARTVVLKLGAQGCLVSDAQGVLAVPGHPVQPVDATGAGDCFCGNLLARLAAGDTLAGAARYANAAAALAVQGFGAVAPLPGPAAVRQLLATA